MANTAQEALLQAIEFRHLHCFAVVAQESSLRRAAERLFMAQPPLSRLIQQLEERLGVALFLRHSKGLTLTDEGAKVLRIIQPLLQIRETTFARLRQELRPDGKVLRLGFTTAFEQGVFAALENRLHLHYAKALRVERASSLKLVQDIRKGRLDAALVALPLEAPGVLVRELAYREPLIAALPALWPEARGAGRERPVSLRVFNGKNVFWFKREKNPAFFDRTKSCFARIGFLPHYVEEPPEHDVLLARIASGEGLGLFAASFASISREGVVFATVDQEDALFLQLGLATLAGNHGVEEDILESFPAD